MATLSDFEWLSDTHSTSSYNLSGGLPDKLKLMSAAMVERLAAVLNTPEAYFYAKDDEIAHLLKAWPLHK